MIDVASIRGSASPATLRDYFDQTLKHRESESSLVVDDQVEISEIATVLSRLAELPERNARRIVEVRRSIEQGIYVTPSKLNAAIDGLLKDL